MILMLVRCKFSEKADNVKTDKKESFSETDCILWTKSDKFLM